MHYNETLNDAIVICPIAEVVSTKPDPARPGLTLMEFVKETPVAGILSDMVRDVKRSRLRGGLS